MRTLCRIAMAALAASAWCAHANKDLFVASALDSTRAWLAHADAGDAAKSYENAARLLQTRVTRQSWEKRLAATRAPLGGAKQRELKSATYARKLNGAPGGEYVIIQYTTRFEFKPQVTETLTQMRENDGSWRVASYNVK